MLDFFHIIGSYVPEEDPEVMPKLSSCSVLTCHSPWMLVGILHIRTCTDAASTWRSTNGHREKRSCRQPGTRQECWFPVSCATVGRWYSLRQNWKKSRSRSTGEIFSSLSFFLLLRPFSVHARPPLNQLPEVTET